MKVPLADEMHSLNDFISQQVISSVCGISNLIFLRNSEKFVVSEVILCRRLDKNPTSVSITEESDIKN